MTSEPDPAPSEASRPKPAATPSRLTPDLESVYEAVYTTDLVYVKDCWTLCGDAHCCSFQRYKSRYRIMARKPFQELPLLPGEWAWLQKQGWDQQFQPADYRCHERVIDGRRVRVESIISRRAGCACDHATRPTICRLYPLLPHFDAAGALIGVERAGIYEEMEKIGNLPSACRLEHMPFDQLTAFLSLCAALGRSALLRWHLEAYRLTKTHAAQRLAERVRATGKDVFAAFEGSYLRATLLDQAVLQQQLTALMLDFDQRWPGWDASL